MGALGVSLYCEHGYISTACFTGTSIFSQVGDHEEPTMAVMSGLSTAVQMVNAMLALPI